MRFAKSHLIDGDLALPTGGSEALATRREIATGRPFRALACTLVNERERAGSASLQQRCQGGLLLEPFRVVRPDESVISVDRVVPLRPLPRGIELNTLVFWAALMVLAWLGVRVRTIARLERGGCPRCGADLGFTFGPGCSACRWRPRAVGRLHA